MRLRLADLDFLESGRMLLQGWLRFAGAGAERALPYNTRSWPAVARFLAAFRALYAPPGSSSDCAVEQVFGEPLDLKFSNARIEELDREERLLYQFFGAARRHCRKWGPLKREHWSPADFVAVTQRRALWITDRHRGRHERYGTVTRYAPARSIAEWCCSRAAEPVALTARFNGGGVWQTPLPLGLEGEAGRFAEALRAGDNESGCWSSP
jgi:hypothetical protein